MAEIGIVLLAAGRGTRFGTQPKLLERLAGRALVRHAAETALASRLGPVFVVLGAHAERVRAGLDGLAMRHVENPRFAEGLSTSLLAGLAALPPSCDGAIVMLGDMPRIRPDHLAALAGAYRAAPSRPAAVVPVHGGRRGNPVLLDPMRLAGSLAALTGDRGAGPLLAGRDDVVELAMDEAVGRDVDTPEALAALMRDRA